MENSKETFLSYVHNELQVIEKSLNEQWKTLADVLTNFYGPKETDDKREVLSEAEAPGGKAKNIENVIKSIHLKANTIREQIEKVKSII